VAQPRRADLQQVLAALVQVLCDPANTSTMPGSSSGGSGKAAPGEHGAHSEPAAVASCLTATHRTLCALACLLTPEANAASEWRAAALAQMEACISSFLDDHPTGGRPSPGLKRIGRISAGRPPQLYVLVAGRCRHCGNRGALRVCGCRMQHATKSTPPCSMTGCPACGAP
jgi:hypothetical protein